MMNAHGTLTVDHLDPADHHAGTQTIALIDREFGYDVTARVRARTLAPHACLVARNATGTVIGALTARIASDADRTLVTRLVPSGNETVGIVDDIAVDPEWRGQGVGTALMDAALRHLRNAGCTMALTEVWRSGRYESFGLATRAGFETVAHVNGYWSAASNDAISGWDCPTCGRPCHCPATLMRRRLH